MLLTSEFPFGKGETFLENEISFLADEFDMIKIVATDLVHKSERRKVPDNVEVQTLSQLNRLDKLKAVGGAFSSILLNERKYWKQEHGASFKFAQLKTALVSLFNAKRIANHLRNEEIKNTVFYSYWCNDAAVAIALLKSRNPKAKSVSRVHGWDLYFEASSIGYLPFRRLISDNLTYLMPISNIGKRYIESRWKVSDENILLQRLGVKGPNNNPLQRENILVSCSNIIPLKRVELIAESVEESEAGFEWHHFGTGPLFERINSYLNNSNLRRIATLHGHVSNQLLHEWYVKRKPKLFINLSSTEGIPVSIMEAMSHGVPVIATEVGGTSEIVDNSNGKLLPENPKPEQVAKQINYFFNLTKDQYLRYSEAAYNTWRGHYNAEINYKAFSHQLIELIIE